MITSKLVLSVATLALLFAAQARAHHSLAGEFDPTVTLDIQGTITKVEWFNPHIWLYLDVVDAEGQTEAWQCEMGSPNQMIRAGWKKDDLPPGTVIHTQANPARDGSNTCSTRRISLDDGTVVSAFGS
ncbi:MAG TPA: DUF6152 family protein [Hyphomicrobiales bacterium]|nr:DUF6152 family protein [Hyphomicrobiales bacterium]